MEGTPKVAASPLELLTTDYGIEKSFITKYYAPVVFAAVGVISVCVGNWGVRRPVFSGIQRHILLGSIGAVAGKYIDGWRDDHLAERDAIYRHYLELHPEDFPPYERKKFADVLERWTPIR